MSDSAKGSLAGYLFQFEKALVELSNLNNSTDYITIEYVDDVAIHKDDDTVLITIQAKHSISPSGTTFEDTSYSLWRTFQIWIEKLEQNIFNEETAFICSTNKKISSDSLLFKIKSQSFDEVITEFEALLASQKDKLKSFQKKDTKSGSSIKQTIRLIELVLKKSKYFETIKKNIQIEDEEDLKLKFLNKIHVMSDSTTDLQRDNIYESFYGWLVSRSKHKWKNDKIALFTKKEFDNKLFQIHSTPSIINAVFRTRRSLNLLGLISEEEKEMHKQELFVKQIEDIKRREDAKKRILADAILDFICYDIEMKYIIEKGDYTEDDFEDFSNLCFEAWQECFDNCVIYEIDSYDLNQRNEIAIKIYTEIMTKIEIKFLDTFCFKTDNKYIKNGSFLKLSNIPTIGWHPEWKTKYKNI